jgi:hypothetical protein
MYEARFRTTGVHTRRHHIRRGAVLWCQLDVRTLEWIELRTRKRGLLKAVPGPASQTAK